jgi:hypothetical protein
MFTISIKSIFPYYFLMSIHLPFFGDLLPLFMFLLWFMFETNHLCYTIWDFHRNGTHSTL